MKTSNKHRNYEILNLLGYGLAKFNSNFISEFGFITKSNFYSEIVKLGIAETEGVIKNRQDLFDPFFENGRKGWWQKGNAYIHRKQLIDSLFGGMNVSDYADIVKIYLHDKFNYNFQIHHRVNPILRSQFKQLQKTGLEAELYFINNYNNIDLFRNSTLKDARLLGDGYDFQIEINNTFYLAEIKGVRLERGAIRMTNNEFEKAKHYKDRYCLSIISNLNSIPKISLIFDPTSKIDLTKNIIHSEQITYNSINMRW